MALLGLDRISVCVCTFRRPGLLEVLLDSLAHQRRDPSFSFEVIVVDNDQTRSAEATVRSVQQRREIDVRYDCEPEQNISLARNRAVRNATGNLIAFIDDDESPDGEWLVQLNRTLKKYAADGVLGPVLPLFPTGAPEWLKKGHFFDRRRLPTGVLISAEDARTGNLLLLRSTFVDGELWFDPAFGRTGGEDSDFFWRQFRRGGVFVWCDEASVHEFVPPERWSVSYHVRRYLRSGTMDGERIRAGRLSSPALLARSGLILVACVVLTPFLLLLPRHISTRVLQKLAYCAGIVAAYCGFSLLRFREEPGQTPRAGNQIKRMLMLAISLAYSMLRSGYRWLVRLVHQTTSTTSPVVLTYHSVHSNEIGRFEEQMRYLKARATPVFADDSESSNGRPRVAVTFDDAFQNVFDHALPVLEKYEIPATVFAPTGFLGGKPGWMAAGSGASASPGMLASAATLAACNSSRVRLGSHTVTHPCLSEIQQSSVHEELAVSKRTLEEITGSQVGMLAFPYGSFSAFVLAEARRVGYDRVFANVPVGSESQDGSLLRGRINVSPWDWPAEFRLKVHGAYEWLAVAVPAKRAVLALSGRKKKAS